MRISSCDNCPIGKSAPAPGLAVCTDCAAGTYSDNPDGAETCYKCFIGKYSSAVASTSCDICDSGTFNLVEGSVGCDKCPGGERLNDYGNGCITCPDGTFSNPGSTSCTDCEHTEGYVSEAGTSGAEKCEYCGPGFRANKDTHQCKQCEVGTYSVGGTDTCSICPSGTDGKKGSSSCSPCPPGTISSSNICARCSKGEYAEYGDTSCSACSGEGQYSNVEGTAVCKTAPAGRKPNSDRTGLVKCTSGTYSVGGSDTCLSCGDGETSSEGAAGCATCATCGVGRYKIGDCSPSNETLCGDCAAGQASMGGEATSCIECTGPGQYSDEALSAACKLAPAGHMPKASRDGIEQCPKNTFSIGATDACMDCTDGGHSKPGSSACEKCSTGKYYDEAENVCESCPKNTATISGASTLSGCVACEVEIGEYAAPGSGYCSVCPQYEKFKGASGKCDCVDTFIRGDDGTCVCKEGWTLQGTECSPCEIGKWKGAQGVNSCNRCEETLRNSITARNGSTSASACICPAGNFENENKKNACEKVLEGMNRTVEGMTLERLYLDPGYWRTGLTSLDIRPCRFDGACVGGNCTGGTKDTMYCREGHYGPYCNLCRKGYSPDAFGLCQICGEKNSVVTFAIFVVGLGILFVCLILCLARKIKKARNDTEGDQDKTPFKRFKNGAKILFAGWQIISSLPSVAPTIDLPPNVKEVVYRSQIFNLNPFQLLNALCWSEGLNYYQELLGMTLPVLIVCGLLFGTGALRGKRLGKRLINIGIAVLYLTLPTISTTIFKVFPCDWFDDGTGWLRADYSITCRDDARSLWKLYGILMLLVFPIGVPFLYFVLLWRKRDSLVVVEKREDDHEVSVSELRRTSQRGWKRRAEKA